MRTLPLMLSVLAVTMLADSLAAEAKSETECRASARQATSEIEGLDFEQALAGCMLDNSRVSPPAAVVIEKTEEPTVIENTEQPTVALPTSQQVPSGTWVRVSPNRWVLRRELKK